MPSPTFDAISSLTDSRNPTAPQRFAGPQRIMVYCHDLFGLGNVRRMLEYSKHLREAYPNASLLFVMGSSRIDMFNLPAGMDIIKLPELCRSTDGSLGARALGSESARALALRKSILKTCAAGFEPDLLLIDKKPLGANDELLETFNVLSPDCARVLVLRDILDASDKTIADMEKSGFHHAVREHIDHIQILGEREIFDMARAYQLPQDIADKCHYAGYVVPQDAVRSRQDVAHSLGLDASKKIVFATVGGGEDGQDVLDRMLQVAEQDQSGQQYVILTGPNLDNHLYLELVSRAVALPHICMLRRSLEVASLIHAADAVVSMAGYNSVCAILAAGKPCVLMPRTEPSQEQLVRTDMLAERGLASFVPQNCDASSLCDAIETALAKPAQLQSLMRFERAHTTDRIAAGLTQILPQIDIIQEGMQPCSA